MGSQRASWTTLNDDQLLAQCAVDTYRASGPGGQKRNKTSSAVRLRHTPSGLIVIAEESRSQHENKARALRRLRRELHLQLREPVDRDNVVAIAGNSDLRAVLNGDGRIQVPVRDARFWPAVALILDLLEAVEARVSEAADILGVSTGNLTSLLSQDAKVWQHANQLRTKFGHKPLK